MKRLSLTIVITLSAVCIALAQMPNAQVTTTTGEKIRGLYMMGTDSSIVIKATENVEHIKKQFGSDVVTLSISDVVKLYMNGEPYQLYEGRFVSLKSIKKQQAIQQQSQQAAISSPNNIFGKAFKTTGTVALGIGVPCLASGLACVIAGHTMSSYGTSGVVAKSNLIEASYYLFPIGASLTIAGIPLYVHGKKLMQMDIKYTGNGMGVAFNF